MPGPGMIDKTFEVKSDLGERDRGKFVKRNQSPQL